MNNPPGSPERLWQIAFATAGPRLLQTVDYARAVMQAVRPTLDYEEIERQVPCAWSGRRCSPARTGPLGLWAVLDEAILHREVGNRGLMRMQLEHLVEVGRLPNVTILVLPYGWSSTICRRPRWSTARRPS